MALGAQRAGIARLHIRVRNLEVQRRRMITIALLFVTAGGVSHLSIVGQTDSGLFKEYVAAIKSGDSPAAVTDAGKTRDKNLVPVLRAVLRKRNYPNKAEASMALAKLGDASELQEFYCKIVTGNDTQTDSSIIALGYIGGGFSFRIIKQVLGEQLAVLPLKSDPHLPADVILDNPMDRAIQSLQALLPKAQVQEADYKRGLEYLDQHWSELSKLEPTGEGVEFSSTACKDRKKRSRTSN